MRYQILVEEFVRKNNDRAGSECTKSGLKVLLMVQLVGKILVYERLLKYYFK